MNSPVSQPFFSLSPCPSSQEAVKLLQDPATILLSQLLHEMQRDITETPWEIERKFLLKSLPADWEKSEKISIQQWYLRCGDPQIRIRQRNRQYFLTMKEGKGMSRKEREKEISGSEYQHLLPLAQKVLSKERYRLALAGGLVAEIDCYPDGTQVVEVEFPDEKSAQTFLPPSRFGADITGDRRFSNVRLARDL